MNNFYRLGAVVELFDHEQHEIKRLYHEEEMIEYGDIKDPANLRNAQIVLSSVLSNIEELAELYRKHVSAIKNRDRARAEEIEEKIVNIVLF